jgi:hypothetical protein
MCKSATDIPLLIKNSYPIQFQFQFQKFEIDSVKFKSNIKKVKILIFLLTQNQTHIPTICPLLHFRCLRSFFVSVHIAKRGDARLVEKSQANQDPQRKLCSIPKKTLSLSLVDFYYNPKSKPKTSPISLSLSLSLSLSHYLSTTCIEEVWKHKLTGEEVKKITKYVCGK